MTPTSTGAPTRTTFDFPVLLERAFVTTIAVAALAYGSASTVQSSFLAIAFALLAMLSILRPIGSAAIRVVRAIAILLAAGLVGYAALQALPIAGANIANGAWKSIADHIAPVRGTISVAPGMTLDALPELALPFLVFVCALVFFQGDDGGLRLWRALAYFGVGYAAIGVLQELFFPEQLLFERKVFYVGSLTATFVNRNTAGTFFGLAFLLNLGLEFDALRKIRLASLVKKTLNFDMAWPDKHTMTLVHLFACLVCAVALFLTQSRGAVGATFVASTFAAALIATRSVTSDAPSDDSAKWRHRAMTIGVVLVVSGLFALFAGRSIYRMEEAGAADGRWCAFASTLEGIHDNWVLGAGFGTFQDVFPVYRDPTCAGITGVWERAHNVFLEGWLGLGAPFLVGLAVGCAVLIAVFVHGVRTRHRLRFAPIVGLAALILATLHSIVDFSLQIPGFTVYFAAAMAAAISISLGRGRA